MGDTLTQTEEKPLLLLSSLIVANLAKANLSPEAVQYYFDHKDEIPKALYRGFVLPPKFGVLADLGIVTVPADYVHETRLDKFMEENRKKFYSVNDNITDANFPNPSRILKPGDRLRVVACQQIIGGTTTSEERMAYLAGQKMAVYPGAQGASLVFDQKRDRLPKGKWYASYDEKDRLWEDAGGNHRVPGVSAYEDGDFDWRLGCFGGVWYGGGAFFGFCDLDEALGA